MSRGNTLEDIGRKAVEASVATSAWRAVRGRPCGSAAELKPCPARTPLRGLWCSPCFTRVAFYERHRRAKNSLLVAIRSYIRRTSAPSAL